MDNAKYNKAHEVLFKTPRLRPSILASADPLLYIEHRLKQVIETYLNLGISITQVGFFCDDTISRLLPAKYRIENDSFVLHGVKFSILTGYTNQDFGALSFYLHVQNDKNMIAGICYDKKITQEEFASRWALQFKYQLDSFTAFENAAKL